MTNRHSLCPKSTSNPGTVHLSTDTVVSIHTKILFRDPDLPRGTFSDPCATGAYRLPERSSVIPNRSRNARPSLTAFRKYGADHKMTTTTAVAHIAENFFCHRGSISYELVVGRRDGGDT